MTLKHPLRKATDKDLKSHIPSSFGAWQAHSLIETASVHPTQATLVVKLQEFGSAKEGEVSRIQKKPRVPVVPLWCWQLLWVTMVHLKLFVKSILFAGCTLGCLTHLSIAV